MRLDCSGLVEKEAVDRGTCSRDVRAERAELAELVGERRRSQIVRWQSREVTRSSHLLEHTEQCGAPFGEAGLSAPVVEARVDVGGRRLARFARDDEDDPVVLRQVERFELGAGARRELGAVREEERDVRADLCGDAVQLLGRQGLARERERRRRVGASAAEAEEALAVLGRAPATRAEALEPPEFVALAEALR